LGVATNGQKGGGGPSQREKESGVNKIQPGFSDKHPPKDRTGGTAPHEQERGPCLNDRERESNPKKKKRRRVQGGARLKKKPNHIRGHLTPRRGGGDRHGVQRGDKNGGKDWAERKKKSY